MCGNIDNACLRKVHTKTEENDIQINKRQITIEEVSIQTENMEQIPDSVISTRKTDLFDNTGTSSAVL